MLLLYDDVLLPDVRGAVPDGLLYAVVVLEELCPETVALPDDAEEAGLLDAVVLLPVTSLIEAVLLVPNELLLVVETRLVTLPAITRLPDVSRRDPLYTSRPKYDPDIGGVTG